MKLDCLQKDIFNIKTNSDFNAICMEVFRFQAENNKIYRSYLDLIETDINSVSSPLDIPCLPIKLFKDKKIVSFEGDEQIIFTSSATTGMVPSKHYVKDLEIYTNSFIKGFEYFYGDVAQYTVLALLPSYLERKGSSLVYMADTMIKESIKSGNTLSGFYLYNYKDLYNTLLELKKENKKTLLIGVSFALIAFVQEYSIDFPNLVVIETGGMKGRGKELSRNELHSILSNGFGVKNIHSEYGMAELMSQAYSKENGVFSTPPWLKIFARDLYNPFSYLTPDSYSNNNPPQGGINIIDLANLYSCSFIETEDIGVVFSNGDFTIDGRIKESELRGCNMLLE